jgi:hypothetical protein
MMFISQEKAQQMLAALKEIVDQDLIELVLDPEWSQRIARAAIATVEAPVFEKITPSNTQSLVGRVILFKKGIEDHEVYAEPGMLAKVTSVRRIEEDLFSVSVSYSPFEEHNKNFELANYYDAQGVPSITAREAGFYSPTEAIYFDCPSRTPWERDFEVVGSDFVK